jgi:WD repeat-containing protein 19
VRKRERGAEGDEPLTACPHCSAAIPATQLECPSCKNSLPYCVATGRHMVLGDWTTCPECSFPALASELVKVGAARIRAWDSDRDLLYLGKDSQTS